jgi:hypothetical protein
MKAVSFVLHWGVTGLPGSRIKRPVFFDNWRAALQNENAQYAYECPLYSDAQIMGETHIGPFRFLNTVAHGSVIKESSVAPVIVLRVDVHVSFEMPEMKKTDTSMYHGGSLSDEAAALAALAMGARIEAGPTTREFEKGDIRGKPIAYYGYTGPALSRSRLGRTLPAAAGTHSLETLNWLSTWRNTDPLDEVALIRAALLYQHALWIADSEPALAWLLLVSAIETAANRWDQSSPSPADRLRDSKPDLVEAIEARCPELLPIVAEKIKDSIGVGKKFASFILNFLPDPPEKRPAEWAQIRWERDNLATSLRTIYNHRSRALHTGVPFPAPMCRPPGKLQDEWVAPEERPVAGAASAGGGVWLQKDMPMYLHSFEYIARKVLQAWWSSADSSQGSQHQIF